MATLRYGSARASIEISDTMEQLYRRSLDELAPGLLGTIETSLDAAFDAAVSAWPVKTGRSKAGLTKQVRIEGDKTSILGTITDAVPYAKYIKARKLGGKSAFVELLRKPMKERASALAQVLGPLIVQTLTGV